MGMFDSFYIAYQSNPRVEVQTKEFESSLSNWFLGDRVDNVPGLRVIKESFNLHNYYTNELSERIALLVLYNGIFVDYSVVSDDLDVARAEIMLNKLWSRSDFASIALTNILTWKSNQLNSANEQLFGLKGITSSYKYYLEDKNNPNKTKLVGLANFLNNGIDFDTCSIDSVLIEKIDDTTASQVYANDIFSANKNIAGALDRVIDIEKAIKDAISGLDIWGLRFIRNNVLNKNHDHKYIETIDMGFKEILELSSISYVLSGVYLGCELLHSDFGIKNNTYIYDDKYGYFEYLLSIKGLSIKSLSPLIPDKIKFLNKHAKIILEYIFNCSENFIEISDFFGEELKGIQIKKEWLMLGDGRTMLDECVEHNTYFIDFLIDVGVDVDNIFNYSGRNFACEVLSSRRGLGYNKIVKYLVSLYSRGIFLSLDAEHNAGQDFKLMDDSYAPIYAEYEKGLLSRLDSYDGFSLKESQIKKV